MKQALERLRAPGVSVAVAKLDHRGGSERELRERWQSLVDVPWDTTTFRDGLRGKIVLPHGIPLMPLLAHLSEADIGRYVAGTASTEAERHARICVSCMERLGDAAQRAFLWERRGLLGRLVRIDPSQAIEELLTEIEEEQRRHAG
jgi:hypothetical protein